MRRTFLFLATAIATAACAHTPEPSNVWIDGVKFTSMGAGTGAFSSTLDGSTNAAAPYTIRVHITEGGKIAPHTHPDPRVITVVDGEVCYGFGAIFDPDGCKLYPEGSYFIVPANAPHYGFGKTGEAVYQESGVGPSGFIPVPGAAQ
ncbi:MAG: cupin domain-containing protein [Hyphomonadaceae bacterium]|nr:cupin domain-containing protein [Hyphomonadaceae bacterium]